MLTLPYTLYGSLTRPRILCRTRYYHRLGIYEGPDRLVRNYRLKVVPDGPGIRLLKECALSSSPPPILYCLITNNVYGDKAWRFRAIASAFNVTMDVLGVERAKAELWLAEMPHAFIVKDRWINQYA